MKNVLAGWFLAATLLQAQGASAQYVEHFDSVSAPALPPGWSTTTNRSIAGDFVTTTSSARSVPNAVLSTNATISQTLTSPAFDFSNCTPVKLVFYSSRSNTHTAGLLVEASLDNGVTFPITLSDTIRNPGTTSYVLSSIQLPLSLANLPRVRIRWRLIAAPAGGATGTFRLDDVSVTALSSHDLSLINLQVLTTSQNSPPLAGQVITLRATIRNVGSQPGAGYSVQFFRDLNSNAVAEQNEQFAVVSGPELSPSDSTSVMATSLPLNAGDNRFIAVVAYPQDTNPSNDTASTIATIGAEPKTLVINEIMYDPLVGQNEWIELYHRGSTPADIARWKFSDRPTASGSNTFVIASAPAVIQPRDFVVIAADSAIFTQFAYLASAPPNIHLFILNRNSGFGLNNDGDDIFLRDATGRTIDSVSYSPGWHHPDVIDAKGRSLERINPEIDSNDRRNWSTSPAAPGGTPGRINGIYTTSLPTNASISVSPNPFSPDGDGFEDFCIIRYNLPLPTSLIRITIFDIKGRMLRTLANSELSGAQGGIIWDGLDDAKERVRIGPYIVFVEAIDGQAGILATGKAVVVVATKL